MKIIFKDMKHGEIKLVAENLDDIWHLYNIIEKGDLVRAVTFRTDEQKDDKIRSKKAEKKRMKLGVRVSEIKFHDFSDRLRIHGNIERYFQNIKPYFDTIAILFSHFYALADFLCDKSLIENIKENCHFFNKETSNLYNYYKEQYSKHTFDLSEGISYIKDFLKNFGVSFKDIQEGMFCNVHDI